LVGERVNHNILYKLDFGTCRVSSIWSKVLGALRCELSSKGNKCVLDRKENEPKSKKRVGPMCPVLPGISYGLDTTMKNVCPSNMTARGIFNQDLFPAPRSKNAKRKTKVDSSRSFTVVNGAYFNVCAHRERIIISNLLSSTRNKNFLRTVHIKAQDKNQFK
jgi:hypothetical protein